MRIVIALLALLCATSLATADNWGHWRGPTGNGAADANPPTQWSETDNVKWKVEIEGKGSGSPVIWGDRVFVVTAAPTGDAAESAPQPAERSRFGRRQRGGAPIVELAFKVICFDRATGKRLWEQVAVTRKPHEERIPPTPSPRLHLVRMGNWSTPISVRAGCTPTTSMAN